jgi:ABC-2 type transport system permease protein
MRALISLQWRERRAARVGWSVAWAVLVAMYVATWPVVRAHGKQYDEILAGLPDAMRAAMGATGGSAFSTPGGYLTAELLAIVGPLVAVTMGVLLGVACLAREEEDGTLEVLLAQPVTRVRLVLARALAAGAEILAVLVLSALVLWGVGAAVDLGLGLWVSLRAMGMLALLAFEALFLSLAIGAATGRAARSRAAAGGVALGCFLVATLGPSIEALEPLVQLSPFRTLVDSDPFRQGPELVHLLALTLPSLLLLSLATWVFRGRDLRLR